MQYRKIIPAIITAMLAIGSTAALTGTASAAPADLTSTSITLNAADRSQLNNHTFKAVKLAEYASDDAGYVSVTTVTTPEEVHAKVVAAATIAAGDELPTGFDPIAYLSGVAGYLTPIADDDQQPGNNTNLPVKPWTGQVRDFVNDLVDDSTLKDASQDVALGNISGSDETGYTADLAMPGAGLYLIFDVTENADNPAIPMMVGTCIKNASNKFVNENGEETKQWPTTYMGAVTIKNDPLAPHGGFSFTLTDVNDIALVGGQFVIKNTDGHYLRNDAGKWVPTESADDAQITSDTATFALTGLADGTYTIEQTKVPDGYLSSAKVIFDVTIKNGVAVYFNETDAFAADNDLGNPNGTDEVTGYQVKNYKNISQLPLTGGSGVTSYVTTGLALIAAAILLQVVTRKKRATN